MTNSRAVVPTRTVSTFVGSRAELRERVQNILVREILDFVDEVEMCHSVSVRAVCVYDIHAQDMLALWPAMAATAEPNIVWDPESWTHHRDSSPRGEAEAEAVTAYGGRPGSRWSHVFADYRAAIVTGCRQATTVVTGSSRAASDFVAVSFDPREGPATSSLTDNQLARSFPSISARERTVTELESLPDLRRHEMLVARLAGSEKLDLDQATALDLLARGGPAAIDTLAEQALELTGDESAACFAALEHLTALGTALTSRTVAGLRDLLHDPAASRVRRIAAGRCLATSGRLSLVVARLETIDEDSLLEILAASYLADRKNGPLDYEPVSAALDAYPNMDADLTALLSPNAMFDVDFDDIATATTALTSRWRFVRSHAAIVMLSTHL